MYELLTAEKKKLNSSCKRNKKYLAQVLLRKNLEKAFPLLGFGETCQMFKEFHRMYGMFFFQLTIPITSSFLNSFAFRWNFDPLGKLSISQDSHFSSLSI